MRRKKIMVWLLTAVLLTAFGGPPVRAAEPAGMTVEVNDVDGGGKYLEVSLLVTAERFKAAGAVLAYDNTVLQLAGWTSSAPVTLTQGASWTAAQAVGTVGVDDLAGKPALAYIDGTETTYGYLYLGADTLRLRDFTTQTRVVTVRFVYAPDKGFDDVTLPSTGSGEDPVLRLAPAAVANGSVVSDQAAVDTGSLAGVVRYAASVTATEDAANQPLAVAWKTAKAPSARPSGGFVSGNFAVTFFDWDGSVIDAVALNPAADLAPDGAEDFTKTLLEAEGSVLKSKLGYTFDRWLLVTQAEGELIPAYGAAFTSNNTALNPENPSIVDFSKIKDYQTDGTATATGMLVQAAYRANEEINNHKGLDTPTTEDAARYTIGEMSYYQLGISTDENTGQYAVRGTVRRSSTVRTETPVVLLQVYIGEGGQMKYLTARCDLRNTDEASFEAAVPKTTTRVTYRVLDAKQLANWAGGTPRSVEGATEGATIVKEGAFALLAEEAHLGWSLANAQCFRDAGYTGVTDENLAAARSALAAVSVDAVPTRAAADNALASYK